MWTFIDFIDGKCCFKHMFGHVQVCYRKLIVSFATISVIYDVWMFWWPCLGVSDGCECGFRRRESQQCFSVHVGTCLTLFVWVCVCHLVSFKRDTTTCSMSSKKDDYKTAASMVIFSIFFYCWERDVYWALKVSDGNSHTAILLPITPSFTEHRTHLMDNLIVCPMVINVAAFLRTLISLH